MHFKITKQFPSQQEVDCARIATEHDAKIAIQALFANDFRNKVSVIYRLFDKYGDVVVQLDTSKDKPEMSTGGSVEASSSDAGGKGQTSGFRPTPFSTTPTPGGPQKWTQLPDDEKGNDENK